MRNNQVLFWVRMRDTNPDLKRNEFIRTLKRELPTQLGVRPDQISYSGPLILYNNMLQRLFGSQIATLGLVIAVLFGMFWCLFRSIKLAAIGIIPNALAVISILGFMGWFGISLDLMTITLAAIAMGIAVDDTIHFLSHYSKLIREGMGRVEALTEVLSGTGVALIVTTMILVSGFGLFIFAHLTPNMNFGILSSFVLFMALVCDLVVLPCIVLTVENLFGKKVKAL